MHAGTRRGLSLIEVVVAVTILAGALFTLGVLIPRSVLHLRNKSYETVATQMAERIFESARGLDAADIPSKTWDSRGSTRLSTAVRLPAHAGSARRQFPPAPYPVDGESPISVPFEVNGQTVSIDYFLSVEVQPPPTPNTPPQPRLTRVTVYWNDQQGDPSAALRSFTLTSQIGL